MKKSLLLSAALAACCCRCRSPSSRPRACDEPRRQHPRRAQAREAKKNAATNAGADLSQGDARGAQAERRAQGLSKQLTRCSTLQDKNDSEDEMIAKADEILADSRANAFDKSSAAYLAGARLAGQGKHRLLQRRSSTTSWRSRTTACTTTPITRRCCRSRRCSTPTSKHAEALVYVDRFLTETQSEDAKALAIKTRSCSARASRKRPLASDREAARGQAERQEDA